MGYSGACLSEFRSEQATRHPRAAPAVLGGGQAGDIQERDMLLCQDRCLRSVSEIKAYLISQQVRSLLQAFLGYCDGCLGACVAEWR
jgi:hypothetical protein